MLRLTTICLLLLVPACARPAGVADEQRAVTSAATAHEGGGHSQHHGHGKHAHGGSEAGPPCEACAKHKGGEPGQPCEGCQKKGHGGKGHNHGGKHDRGHRQADDHGHGHGHGSGDDHGKSRGHGRAHGHDSGDDHGKSRGHGHGHGHGHDSGDDHGKSRGHGHAQGHDSGDEPGDERAHDHGQAPGAGAQSANAAAAAATPGSDSPAASGQPDHYHRRFSNARRWSKSFDNPKRDRWQKPERVVALMNIAEGMAVADIGAGTGYFVPHLSRAVGDSGSVLALDVEADMVRFVTERAGRDGFGNVVARVVTNDDPGLEPASVDRIVIVNTWHHIGQRVPYTKQLAAALRPGGTVTIVDYTVDAPRGPPRKHRLPPAKVVEELAAGGLDTRIVEEDLPLQYIVVGARR